MRSPYAAPTQKLSWDRALLLGVIEDGSEVPVPLVPHLAALAARLPFSRAPLRLLERLFPNVRPVTPFARTAIQ
jgi:hypothetical protein